MAKKAAKKGSKKKASKKKTARKPSTRGKSGMIAGSAQQQEIRADIVIKVGCEGMNCVSDFDGMHTGGAGTVILFCAQTSDVKLHFRKGGADASPFQSPTNPLTVHKGKCLSETIAAGASGTYSYHLTCSNPGCGSPASDPTMIVP